jgi:hypothetical protein
MNIKVTDVKKYLEEHLEGDFYGETVKTCDPDGGSIVKIVTVEVAKEKKTRKGKGKGERRRGCD